jgi:hypothetical protein
MQLMGANGPGAALAAPWYQGPFLPVGIGSVLPLCTGTMCTRRASITIIGLGTREIRPGRRGHGVAVTPFKPEFDAH